MTYLPKRFRKKFRRYRRKIKKILKKPALHPLYCLIITVLILSVFFPKILADFLWQYYWGPIVADANGGYAYGIKEGYNIVNSTTYAIILAFSLYLIYLLLKRLKIGINFRLISAFIPLIIGASFARVLEDAGMVDKSGAYIFISPFIYIWIGSFALFILLYSAFLERREKYEAMVLSVIPYPLFIRFFWFFMGSIRVSEDIVFFILIISLYMTLHFFFVRRVDFERDSSLFLYSMFFLTVMTYYLSISMVEHGIKNAMEIPLALFVAAAILLFVHLLSAYVGRFREILGEKTNMLMFFSNSLGYPVLFPSTEYGKAITLSSAGLPFLFLFIKLLSVFLIIYLLDVRYDEKMDENAKNLIKFAIIILGMGPGLRDLIRTSMGV